MDYKAGYNYCQKVDNWPNAVTLANDGDWAIREYDVPIFNDVDALTSLTAQVSSLSNMLNAMSTNMDMGPQMGQLEEVSCVYCGDGHTYENCPSNPTSFCFVGNQYRNSPNVNSFNQGWSQYPNFAWRDQEADPINTSMPSRPTYPLGYSQQVSQPKPQQAVHSNSLENFVREYMVKNDTAIQSLAISVRSLENQVGQLANDLRNRPQGTLPSDMGNPKRNEHCKAMTSSSGKELTESKEKSRHKDEPFSIQSSGEKEEKAGTLSLPKSVPAQNATTLTTQQNSPEIQKFQQPSPFPQQFQQKKQDVQFKRFLDVLKTGTQVTWVETNTSFTPFGGKFESPELLERKFKPSQPPIEEPPELELKSLPKQLKYAYLGENTTLPMITSASLNLEKENLPPDVLKRYKKVVGLIVADLKDTNSSICMHRILLEEYCSNFVEQQQKLNPIMKKVEKNEVIKWLDSGIIYPIFDSSWVSLIQCIPINGGVIIVANDYWATRIRNMDLKLAWEKRMLQLNDLEDMQPLSHGNVTLHKKKTKRWQDKHIQPRVFDKGQRVSLCNSQLKLCLGKLKSRWSGLFLVAKLYPHGAVDVRDEKSRKEFKVNGQRLKHFWGGKFERNKTSTSWDDP